MLYTHLISPSNSSLLKGRKYLDRRDFALYPSPLFQKRMSMRSFWSVNVRGVVTVVFECIKITKTCLNMSFISHFDP